MYNKGTEMKGSVLMRTNYEIRAQKLIKKFFPYFFECIGYGTITINKVEKAVTRFNESHRAYNVQVANGSSRIVLLCSDYAIKMDYDGAPFGGCEDEIAIYKKACEYGVEEAFAPISRFSVEGYDFYIMPKVKIAANFGYGHPYLGEVLSEEEVDFINSFVTDTHEYNYGKLHNRWVMVDYACKRGTFGSDDNYSSYRSNEESW